MPDSSPILTYIFLFIALLLSTVALAAYYVTGKYYLKKLTRYHSYHTECIWHHPLKQTWYICLALFNMKDIRWVDTANPFAQLPLEQYRRPVDTVIASIYITLYGLLCGIGIMFLIGIFILQIGFLVIHGQRLWQHIQ